MENNVQSNNSLNDGQPIDIEEAILAKWDDAGENQSSEAETEANPEVELEEEEPQETETEDLDDEDLEEDTDPEEDEEADDDSTEDTEEAETEDDDQAKSLSDDATVDVLVDGEKRSVSVSDLKRLYGQEQSLTRKSQETAAQRKEAEAAMEKNHQVFQTMLGKAEERWKPFSEVDMLLASKSMATEDFALLRKEAQVAFDDLRFLTEESNAFYNDIQTKQKADQQDSAKQCVKTLQEDIPEWSNKLYNDIRSYAVTQGLPEDQVNQYVDPNVIKLINKARLYDLGKQVSTVKKKAAATKKVLRSKRAPDPKAKSKSQIEKTRAKVIASAGRDDDAIAEAILAGWEAQS